MTLAQSNFARRLWAARQALFPSFQTKRYHLQFRHATLILLAFMCAAFTMPAYHQTMPFSESVYNTSDDIPVEPGYNRVRRFVRGIRGYNAGVAAFIMLNVIIEPFVQRSAPVWYEITWMLLLVVGDIVCLALMASSEPLDICDRSYPVVPTPDPRGGFVPSNSAQSVCSNWRGMTGLLATIVFFFVMHASWHLIVSFRHRATRQGVFTLPITDYHWSLSAAPERVEKIFPGDIEKASPTRSNDEKHIESFSSSGDYTTKGTNPDTLSFPGSLSINEEYSNYSRTGNAPKLQALPANSKPVILEQSIITQSDTSSILSSDRANSPQSPKEPAPFTYSNRV